MRAGAAQAAPAARGRGGAAPCGGADQRRRVRDGARRRRLRRRAADRARRPRAVGVRSLRRRLPHRFPGNAGTAPETGARPRPTSAPAPCSRPLPTTRAGDPRMGWRARRARPKPPEPDCDDHDCDDDEDCRADMRCNAAKGAAARPPNRPGRPLVQEDRGGAKPRSPASARRPRTPRPDEKGASATPSRTKAKAAHGRRGDSPQRSPTCRLRIPQPPADGGRSARRPRRRHAQRKPVRWRQWTAVPRAAQDCGSQSSDGDVHVDFDPSK